MNITYKNYPNGYVKVKELMKENLPRPRLKPTILVTGWGEFLPLIEVDI